MTYVRRTCAFLAIWITLLHYALGDFEYMVSKPESITVQIDFETLLLCEMNIEPDKFQWKFYPLEDPYDRKASINLSNATFSLIPDDKYRNNRKKSELTIQVTNVDVAGDYQCLAYYGASVVASVPWRITLAQMKKNPPQRTVAISVQTGNTVSWRCDVPESNPKAYVDYNKGKEYVHPPFLDPPAKSMILGNVSVADSGTYGCTATTTFQSQTSDAVLKLEVLKNGPPSAPKFIVEPLKEYTAIKGTSVFLECSSVGKPIPKVTWFKKQSQLPSNRIEMVPGGLIIRNITSTDDGVYVCNHTNNYGSISHQITVKYNEEPSIDCFMNMTDIKQEENMDIDCEIKGTPEPQIAWFLNGFSVLNDSAIEVIGNKVYFRPIEKRHAGNLQIFARNDVKTVDDSISIRVIPLTSSMDEVATPVYTHPRHNHRKSQNTNRPSKHKSPKMIPPSKPIIARLNDETVVVRWHVPNNNGLPIQFFKVQFKEVGSANHKDNYSGNKGSGWNTANTDIPPNIKAYDISGLKPEHIYKFRVAAVYTNNDSKMSLTSKKFHLRRLDFDEKNPLPLCLITHVETVNHTAVKIYWECPEYNVTIDGFYISYMTATRAGDDYMKSTVEGENTRNYIINYLHPETSYDIKMQSFNSKLASEFSPLMKGRTGIYITANPVAPPATTIPTTSNTKKSSRESTGTDSNIYIIIAGGVVGFALVITGIILLFVCRKWQRKKLSDNRDKPVDHHIQADDYIVEPKAISRTNGSAIPGNRITITSNPLAENDNKNPTVIEMRNLANNNVRQQADSLTSSLQGEGHSTGPKEKNRHRKNVRGSGEDGSTGTGSNYV